MKKSYSEIIEEVFEGRVDYNTSIADGYLTVTITSGVKSLSRTYSLFELDNLRFPYAFRDRLISSLFVLDPSRIWNV